MYPQIPGPKNRPVRCSTTLHRDLPGDSYVVYFLGTRLQPLIRKQVITKKDSFGVSSMFAGPRMPLTYIFVLLMVPLDQTTVDYQNIIFVGSL